MTYILHRKVLIGLFAATIFFSLFFVFSQDASACGNAGSCGSGSGGMAGGDSSSSGGSNGSTSSGNSNMGYNQSTGSASPVGSMTGVTGMAAGGIGPTAGFSAPQGGNTSGGMGCAGSGCDHPSGGNTGGGSGGQCSDKQDNDGDGKRDYNGVTIRTEVEHGGSQGAITYTTKTYLKDPDCSGPDDDDEDDNPPTGCDPNNLTFAQKLILAFTGKNPCGSSTPNPPTTTRDEDDDNNRVPQNPRPGNDIEQEAPALNITASPSRVRPGSTATVGWAAVGVTSCVVQKPDGSTWTGTSGSEETGPITSEHLYTLVCQSRNGQLTDTATVRPVASFQEI